MADTARAFASSRSKELFERAKQIFPGGVNSPVRAFKSVHAEPFMVSRAKGPYLFDADGNKFVDYVMSWGPMVLGHAHPAVVEAVTEQAARGTSYGACSELESELAERIKEFVPSMSRLRFVNSGTEAAMSVIRLARGFTGRDKIIKFAGCYHGHVDSLLAQAGSGVATFSLPDCAGVPESYTRDTIICEYNNLESVRAVFEEYPEDIAAVIVEPVAGNMGLIKPAKGFLEELRSITKKNSALLIFDEVMSGFRVSLMGAQGLYGIDPDLTMLGKVIGGGLPVGAFGGRAEIMQMLAPQGPVYQAGTLSGNPLAMAAGVATLDEWGRSGVFERAEKMAKELCRALDCAASKAGIPIQTSQVGTMFGFFFSDQPVANYSQAKEANTDRFEKFFKHALASGVYFAPSQFEAGFVSIAHEGEALQFSIETVGNAFNSL